MKRVCTLLLSVLLLLGTAAVLPWSTILSAHAAEERMNFALKQTVEASSDYVNPEGFYSAAFLVDGQWGTYAAAGDKLGWHTDPFGAIEETTPVDITLTLDAVYMLDEIILKPQQWNNGEAFPRDFLLQVSMNGTDWTTVAKGKNVDASASSNVSVKPISYSIKATQLKYFRIHITKNSSRFDGVTGAYYSGIGELELMGTYDESAVENNALQLNKSSLRMQPRETDAPVITRGNQTVDATWSSEDPSIVTVDAEGRVKAIAYGKRRPSAPRSRARR